MGKAIPASSVRTQLGKVPNWVNAYSLAEKKETILVCVCGRYEKLAGKKQNIDPMWKRLMKEVDSGEPTSFLDHVYLGSIQRECQTSKDIEDNYRNMFESKIYAGATEKLPYSEKRGANISSWSYDMESHAKKCAHCQCHCPKTFTLYRAVSYVTPHLTTPSTGTPSSLFLNPSFGEHKPCRDLRPQLSGALAEPPPFASFDGGEVLSIMRSTLYILSCEVMIGVDVDAFAS